MWKVDKNQDLKFKLKHSEETVQKLGNPGLQCSENESNNWLCFYIYQVSAAIDTNTTEDSP